MSKSAAERKAEETKRKAEQGLFRRSFWLDSDSMKIIEDYAEANSYTKDEAIKKIIANSHLIKGENQ